MNNANIAKKYEGACNDDEGSVLSLLQNHKK